MRSRTQVVFTVGSGSVEDHALVEQFMSEANDNLGWLDIRSHHVGFSSDAIRVTIHEHQTVDTIKYVRDFMHEFQKRHDYDGRQKRYDGHQQRYDHDGRIAKEALCEEVQDMLDRESAEARRGTTARQTKAQKKTIMSGDIIEAKSGKVYYECTVLELFDNIVEDGCWAGAPKPMVRVRWEDGSESTIPKATIRRKK